MDRLEQRSAPIADRFGNAADRVLEARVSPRVAADIPVEIYGTGFSGALRARTRDISVRGACIATQSMVAVRSLTQIVIHFPEETVRIPAQGRWQTDSSAEGNVLFGLAFDDVDHTTAGTLWNYVQSTASILAQFLETCDAFAGFSSDEVLSTAQMSRFLRILPGRMIYHPTLRESDSIFVVCGGQVGLNLRFGAGRDLTLARVNPGGVFGGLPLVANMPNLETASAVTETRLLEISHGSFSYARLAKPILAQRLTQVVTRGYAERVGQLLKVLASRERAGR